MYVLRMGKKHRWIILCFHAFLLITTIIVDEFHAQLFPAFLLSAFFFWVIQYFVYKFLANIVTLQTVTYFLLIDILILGGFVLFLVERNIIVYMFLWTLIPVRTQTVFFCKRFNINNFEEQ